MQIFSTNLAQASGQALTVYIVEEFGGPCRGRTYGPLIKSPSEELPQELRTTNPQKQRKSRDGTGHRESSYIRVFRPQLGTRAGVDIFARRTNIPVR